MGKTLVQVKKEKREFSKIPAVTASICLLWGCLYDTGMTISFRKSLVPEQSLYCIYMIKSTGSAFVIFAPDQTRMHPFGQTTYTRFAIFNPERSSF